MAKKTTQNTLDKHAMPARVWKRILAFIVDLYLCIIVTIGFFAIIKSELPTSVSSAFTQAASTGLTSLAQAALIYIGIFILLYHIFCEYIVGQTPGMMLFGLHVKRKEESEKALSFGQALGRNLFVLPFPPFTLLWIAEPAYYVFQGERLFEHWTKTTTVEYYGINH